MPYAIFEGIAGITSADCTAYIVDKAGTILATLLNATDPNTNFGSIEWVLNGPGSATFTLPNYSLSRDVLSHKSEIQIWRNGSCIWWGYIERVQSNEIDTTVQCVGLMGYFDGRYYGKAGRTNYLPNGGFEQGANGWTVATDGQTRALNGTIPQPPLWVDAVPNGFHGVSAVAGGQVLRCIADCTNPDVGVADGNLAAGFDQYVWQELPNMRGGDLLTLSGWFYITPYEWFGPAAGNRGLFIEAYQAGLDDNNHRAPGGMGQGYNWSTIDNNTPRGQWIKTSTTISLPANGNWDVFVRLYVPGTEIWWDELGLFKMESIGWFSTRQSTILAGINDYAQGRGSLGDGKSDLRILSTTPKYGATLLPDPTTADTYRTYVEQFADHAPIGRSISDFANLDNGFDFSVDSPDGHIRYLQAYMPYKGTDRSATVTITNTMLVGTPIDHSYDGSQLANSVVVLGEGSGPDREERGAARVDGNETWEIMQNARPGTVIDRLDSYAHETLNAHITPRALTITMAEPEVDLLKLVDVGDIVGMNVAIGVFDAGGKWRVMTKRFDPQTELLTWILNPSTVGGPGVGDSLGGGSIAPVSTQPPTVIPFPTGAIPTSTGSDGNTSTGGNTTGTGGTGTTGPLGPPLGSGSTASAPLYTLLEEYYANKTLTPPIAYAGYYGAASVATTATFTSSFPGGAGAALPAPFSTANSSGDTALQNGTGGFVLTTTGGGYGDHARALLAGPYGDFICTVVFTTAATLKEGSFSIMGRSDGTDFNNYWFSINPGPGINSYGITRQTTLLGFLEPGLAAGSLTFATNTTYTAQVACINNNQYMSVWQGTSPFNGTYQLHSNNVDIPNAAQLGFNLNSGAATTTNSITVKSVVITNPTTGGGGQITVPPAISFVGADGSAPPLPTIVYNTGSSTSTIHSNQLRLTNVTSGSPAWTTSIIPMGANGVLNFHLTTPVVWRTSALESLSIWERMSGGTPGDGTGAGYALGLDPTSGTQLSLNKRIAVGGTFVTLKTLAFSITHDVTYNVVFNVETSTDGLTDTIRAWMGTGIWDGTWLLSTTNPHTELPNPGRIEVYSYDPGTSIGTTIVDFASMVVDTFSGGSTQQLPAGGNTSAQLTGFRHVFDGSTAPQAGVPATNFSYRARGRFDFAAGLYTFTVTNLDDGLRAYIDGAKVFDSWQDQGPTNYTWTSTLTAGTHELWFEYYNGASSGEIGVAWAPTLPNGTTGSGSTGTGTGTVPGGGGAIYNPTGTMQQGVFEWAWSGYLDIFEQTVGAKVMHASSYCKPAEGTDVFQPVFTTATDTRGGFTAWLKADSRRTMTQGFNYDVKGSNGWLDTSVDDQICNIIQTEIINRGIQSQLYIMLFEEFNGATWAASYDGSSGHTLFKTMFQRISARVKLLYNFPVVACITAVSTTNFAVDITPYLPNLTSFDILAIDIYDWLMGVGGDPDTTLNGPRWLATKAFLDQAVAWATTNSKAIAVNEYALVNPISTQGGGDDGYWLQQFLAYCSAHNFTYLTYFNVGLGNVNGSLTPDGSGHIAYPNGLAAYSTFWKTH